MVFSRAPKWARGKSVGSFSGFFGLLRIAEKSSKKAVDGKEDWVLYPALSQTGPAKLARTDAADTWPKGQCLQDV
jgi:hypothetical protein